MRACSLGVVLLALGCDGGAGGPRREIGRFSHTLAPAALRGLRVELGAGSVQVRASADDKVRTEVAVWHVEPPDATPVLGAFADYVTLREQDGVLVLGDAHRTAPDSSDWELRVVVHVPAGIDLHLRVAAGAIQVALPSANDVDVGIDAGSVKGDVPSIAGQCRIRTGSGEVQWAVREQGPSGGLDCEGASGQVDLTLPSSVRGSFDVSVSAGNVRVDGRYGLTVERLVAGASLRGSLGEGGPAHRVRLQTGEVVLR